MTKLAEDFAPWWGLHKYKNLDIPAREFSDCEIVEQHASNRGWPGDQKDVEYWVELDNGFAVGFRHGRTESGARLAKYAEFPIEVLKNV